jgi:iron(III) transport system ATP-binding protein
VREETLAVLRETHVTSLIVTHDPEEAMVLGDRVALLRHGRIAQIGTAAEIYRQPIDLSAARFFSPLSEIESVVKGGHAPTPLGMVATPGLADGTAVTIAIRPAGGARMAILGPGTPGRIVGKRDAIGIDICEVSVEGLDQPLGLRQPADAALSVGQDVFVTLNREHVLVFARD